MFIGVDTGGTFTDVVAYDEATGAVSTAKVPSTPGDFTDGFLASLRKICAEPSAINRLLHGTTVTTNAAIERKGTRAAAVFTKGFRDVLEIGTGQRFVGGLFDPSFEPTKPLVERSLSLEVRERMDANGRELVAMSTADLEEAAQKLAALDVEAVAICLLNAHANDSHERAAAQFLAQRLPRTFICRSADILPQIREYERFSTAAFNAYLGPVLGAYLSRLEAGLRTAGCQSDLLLMSSNGGTISGRHAVRYPVLTVLSGPAGGISAGLHVGRSLNVQDFITCDMGGTSTDVCLVKALRPSVTSQRIVSGLPLRLPQLDIATIGAGGGSIARVASDGSFSVGPLSAASYPGPACYARGGVEPTVTDANLILGRLGDSSKLGGAMRLSAPLARRAVETIAPALATSDLAQAAQGIIRLAVSNMASAIRDISILRGEDPRRFALMAFGGAGPMHGCEVADEVGITRVVVPTYPGNFSAFGLLVSDLRHEIVRSHVVLLDDANMADLAQALNELRREGLTLLATEGMDESSIEVRLTLDLRFKGQAAALALDVEVESLSRDALRQAFRKLYRETWSHDPEGAPVQIVNLRLTAIGRPPRIALPPPATAGRTVDALKERRPVFFGGCSMDTPVYDRPKLPAGVGLDGPAVIDEDGATTIVPPAWRLAVHPSGHLLVEKN